MVTADGQIVAENVNLHSIVCSVGPLQNPYLREDLKIGCTGSVS